MTLDEMEAACDESEARGAFWKSGPEIILVVPGKAGKSPNRRVAPGLYGLILNETQQADGTFQCVVAAKTKDVRRFIKRARYRAAFHGGGAQ